MYKFINFHYVFFSTAESSRSANGIAMSPDVNDNGPSPGSAPGGPGGTRYEGQLRRELALLQQTYSETAQRCDGAMQEADYYKQKYKQASEEGERLQGVMESSELWAPTNSAFELPRFWWNARAVLCSAPLKSACVLVWELGGKSAIRPVAFFTVGESFAQMSRLPENDVTPALFLRMQSMCASARARVRWMSALGSPRYCSQDLVGPAR